MSLLSIVPRLLWLCWLPVNPSITEGPLTVETSMLGLVMAVSPADPSAPIGQA